MIVIKKIVAILGSNESSQLILDKLGVVNKIVGDNFILSPFDKKINGISLVIKSNNLLSIRLTLCETILFKELIDEFSNDYYLGFNHYDEESAISFDYGAIIIRAIKSGYIEKENLNNLSFDRFEIKKK
jgi:hypothetical protein